MTSNAPPSRYYRSCWHLVSPGFSSDLCVIIFIRARTLQLP